MTRIAIIGAAGLRTPLIVNAIAARQEELGIRSLALMDNDARRLDIISRLTLPIESSGKLSFNIERTTDARKALAGADYVITTFRVGGMAGRVIDERSALELGVLGQETTGAGGFAMGMRSIPVLLGYVDLMREFCPQAWLINFANPSGMMAEAVFAQRGWERAVGICDAPSSMLHVAAALSGFPEEDLYLDYFGLNHLGWIRSIRYGEEDLVPGFLALLKQTGGFTDFPFDPDFLLSLGMIPNEYLYYYYSSREAVSNILNRGQTRGEQLLEMNGALFEDLRALEDKEDVEGMQVRYTRYLDERGASYMKTETATSSGSRPQLPIPAAEGGYAGVALDLISSLQGVKPRRMTLNVPNRGCVTGMGEGDVVEIPCEVTRDDIQPLTVGGIPGHSLGLMRQVKAYEQLTIAAAVEGSWIKAVQALTIHPLVADFSLARQLVDTYRQRHGDLFPGLA